MASHTPPRIKLIGSVTPRSDSRAWQTAVHPRLPMLATCNSDKVVNVYSLSNFTQLSSITGGHKRSIRTVAWKPNLSDESILATGSFDASVGIWRREDGYGSSEHAGGGGGGSSDPTEMDFTRDSNGDASLDEAEEEEEWRFALVLDGHDSEVKSVAWSAGGNLLATCARDKSVWIWEEVGEDDFETVAVLQEHGGDVKTVCWHPEEELLASGSYDDEIRLWREDVDDWDCVAVLRGHAATVWMLDFEPLRPHLNFAGSGGSGGSSSGSGEKSAVLSDAQQRWITRREAAGPRLVSCSDDRTIRVWRRVPRQGGRAQQNALSIIRSGSIEEDWVEEVQLPAVHELAIYAVAWSRASGRIVSTGADGRVVVYEERWAEATEGGESPTNTTETTGTTTTTTAAAAAAAAAAETNAAAELDATRLADKMDGSGNGNTTGSDAQAEAKLDALTSWHVVAQMQAAHGVHEVNHATWSRRTDRGKAYDGEEVIVSTGDDGAVNIWSLDE